MAKQDLCPCGLPLHYTSDEMRQAIEKQIAELGPNLTINVPGRGSLLVPRHYVALHGIDHEWLSRSSLPPAPADYPSD